MQIKGQTLAAKRCSAGLRFYLDSDTISKAMLRDLIGVITPAIVDIVLVKDFTCGQIVQKWIERVSGFALMWMPWAYSSAKVLIATLGVSC